MTNTQNPMPRDLAIQKLDHINRWKQELPDAHADLIGLRSSWQVGGLHGALAEDVPMPHGLDAVFDDVDTLGAPGIRTENGVNEMLESLALMVANDHGLQAPQFGPGWWLRETLQMFSEDFWHDWSMWETFTLELAQVHGVVARLCGRSSVTVSLCPECGGKIKARMFDDGKSDEGECVSCGQGFDLSGPDWDAALIERLRSPKISRSVLVTHKQLHAIHPKLSRERLKKWFQRGLVERRAGKVVLADVNARMC